MKLDFHAALLALTSTLSSGLELTKLQVYKLKFKRGAKGWAESKGKYHLVKWTGIHWKHAWRQSGYHCWDQTFWKSCSEDCPVCLGSPPEVKQGWAALAVAELALSWARGDQQAWRWSCRSQGCNTLASPHLRLPHAAWAQTLTKWFLGGSRSSTRLKRSLRQSPALLPASLCFTGHLIDDSWLPFPCCTYLGHCGTSL